RNIASRIANHRSDQSPPQAGSPPALPTLKIARRASSSSHVGSGGNNGSCKRSPSLPRDGLGSPVLHARDVDRRDADPGILLHVPVMANVPFAALELSNSQLGGLEFIVKDFRLDCGPADERPADRAARLGSGGEDSIKA